MPNRVLLVEDDVHLALVLGDALAAEGFRVDHARTGEEALQKVLRQSYDLVLLDVTLPGKNGFEVCTEMRGSGIHTPVLMLTARATLDDKLRGLDHGADDYLTKPFDVRELLARIRALIRRSEAQRVAGLWEYRFNDTFVEFFSGIVIRRGEKVSLSAKELQLLRYLIAHRGAIVSREELLEKVWGYQGAVTRTVDVHIASLRNKLEDNPHEPRYILTSRGEGYLFQDEQAERGL